MKNSRTSSKGKAKILALSRPKSYEMLLAQVKLHSMFEKMMYVIRELSIAEITKCRDKWKKVRFEKEPFKKYRNNKPPHTE